MRATGVLLHYLTVSIGWKVVHGMGDTGLLSAQTVRYEHHIYKVLFWDLHFLKIKREPTEISVNLDSMEFLLGSLPASFI